MALNKLTKQHLENALHHVAAIAPELKAYSLVDADGRLGKKVALAIVSDGSLSVHTDYLTYSEMNQFLRGYLFKADNRLAQKKKQLYYVCHEWVENDDLVIVHVEAENYETAYELGKEKIREIYKMPDFDFSLLENGALYSDIVKL